MLSVLQAKARCEMAKVDMLLVPTALHHYTVKEIYQQERDSDKVGLDECAALKCTQGCRPAYLSWLCYHCCLTA